MEAAASKNLMEKVHDLIECLICSETMSSPKILPCIHTFSLKCLEHYGKYKLISLTTEQQQLVDKVSEGIYRPCCNNSTHFPDCNHGMAMLGLLELLASQGASEEEVYRVALAVNSYWFPDTYITIAAYKQDQGVEWKDVDAKEVLGVDYSSASGFAKIASQVTASSKSSGGGGGCGVEQAPRQQSGCGVGEQTRAVRPQSGCGV